ncbi:MAG: hypothetical protein SF123_24870 [Chloroflexota bacterium]|nr:hypothetical protein [Chloroflexota bacterium]
MWVAADYEATALFSLKPASATASGGRTLPVPTPFAVKMALLDVACRVEGVRRAQAAWTWLNGCRVALRPAVRLVINNTFIKVLRPRRNPAEAGSPDAGFFQRTISYREYAYLDGAFGLALEVAEAAQAAALREWMGCLNYLGKRGGFIQLAAAPDMREALDGRYVVVGEPLSSFPLDSLLLQLDDTSPSLTFEKADIYSGRSIRLGVDRVLHHVALPYRLIRSSRGYSYYELSDGES